MQTSFTSKAQLLREITKGQELYLENHADPRMSRITHVTDITKIFFAVEWQGRKALLMNSYDLKFYGLTFDADREQVHIYIKSDNRPCLSLYFNPTIIAGKKSVSQPARTVAATQSQFRPTLFP